MTGLSKVYYLVMCFWMIMYKYGKYDKNCLYPDVFTNH